MADMRKEISERFKKCRKEEKISARKLAHVLVSEETLKDYTDDSIRQKIGKIERGTTDPEPIILKAYCKHFGVTSDFLLGIRDVKTTNEDIAMICEYTELSDESIEEIKNMSDFEKLIFDKMISHYGLINTLIRNIKRFLSISLYKNHIRLEIDDKVKKYDKGIAILTNTLNNSDINKMIYSVIDDNLNDIYYSLEKDKDISKIVEIYTLDNTIRNLRSAEDLPNFQTYANDLDGTVNYVKPKEKGCDTNAKG